MKLQLYFSKGQFKVKTQTLCLLRLSAIGDVCHAVAMVERIQRTRPDIAITWVIGKIEHQLVGDMPNINFIVVDKSAGKAAYRKLQDSLAGQIFDALFVMQVALRANWVSRHIKAKIKVGFDWSRSKELHSLFINKRIKSKQHAHVLEGFMGFADAIDIPQCEDIKWNIPISPSDTDWATEQAMQLGPFVVISPAASKAERNWLPERYAAVADYLNSKQFKVILCGGPGKLDQLLGQQIEQHTNNISLSYIGQTSLKQMLALLQKAQMVIAPDTGPAHMATTVTTPVVGLYAHSNPRRTGPYLSLQYTASVYNEIVEQQHGKPWDKLAWGTRAKGEDLMKQISTSQVIAKIDEVLAVIDRA
jgi:heptosyltransferase I